MTTNRGGRPSKNNLLLTADEFTWLSRAVGRKAVIVDKSKNDRLKKEVISLNDKLTKITTDPQPQLPGSDIQIATNRNQVRYIQELARRERELLLLKVIPGYQQRGLTTDKPYLAAAITRQAMLEGLLNKVERMLG